jgi:hypothetical protein
MKRILLCAALACAGCSDDFARADDAVVDGEQGVRLVSFGAQPEPQAAVIAAEADVDQAQPSDDGTWPFPRIDEAPGVGAAERAAPGPGDPSPAQLERMTVRVTDEVFEPTFGNLSLEDVEMEDLLDALLYPDEYTDEERAFPEHIAQMEGREVAIVGYQIPLEWKDRVVLEMMLVGDLMGCCFGGAPQPDQWLNVRMQADKGCKYFPYMPVVVKGTFRITPLEDEAGYAAGCYHIDAVSVEKE